MRENTFLPCRLYNLQGKKVLRGSGGGAPSEKMEFLVGENLQSYTKIYIEQCKMGIKNSKIFLNKGGGILFKFFPKFEKCPY